MRAARNAIPSGEARRNWPGTEPRRFFKHRYLFLGLPLAPGLLPGISISHMKYHLAAILAISLPVSALADVVIEQRYQSTLSKDTPMIMKFKGHKARVDMAGDDKMTTLINMQTGDMAMLSHKDKRVMKLNMNVLQQGAETRQKNEGFDPAKVETKSTGTFEQVGPWKAEVYEFKHADKTGKLWAVRDFPDADLFKAELKKIHAASTHGYDYGKVDVPGMIVKSQTSTPIGSITVTLVKATQTPVADAEFTMPKGYSEPKLPAGPR